MVRVGFSIVALALGSFASTAVALPTVNGTRSFERRAEVTSCYDSGFTLSRTSLIESINGFCSQVIGKQFGPGAANGDQFTTTIQKAVMTVKSVNGCKFTADNNCGRLMRKPVDEYDTTSTEFKQGGFVTDGCSWWGIDPTLFA